MPVGTDPEHCQHAGDPEKEWDLEEWAVLPKVCPSGRFSHGGDDVAAKCLESFAMVSQSVISSTGRGGKALEVTFV